MYVNGVDTAQVNETEYTDGWIRTFRKKDIPRLSGNERNILTDYLKENKYEEIVIYLQHFRGVDDEIAGFVLRDLIRGNP
jgi:hypothetical protein